MKDTLLELLNLQLEAVNEKTNSDRLIAPSTDSTEEARQVAKNPNTSPDLLRELSASKDAITCKYVAANPNTPTDVLLELGSEFPEQLLDNPIFSLLLLENPNLVNQMPSMTLVSLLKQERVPIFFLERAASNWNEEVHLAVAINAQTPKAVLEKLVQSPYREVSEAAQLHVNWAGEMTSGWDEAVKEAIQKTAKSIEFYQIEELAEIGLIPEFVIESLDDNDKLLQRLAKNPNISGRILEKLAMFTNWDIRLALASNPNTPGRILEQLAKDNDEEIRWDVARNPNTPGRVLEELAQHLEVSDEVLLAVAMNPQTPRTVLEKLIQSEYNPVAEIAQLHKNWVGEIIQRCDEAASETSHRKTVDQNDEAYFIKLAEIDLISEFVIESLRKNNTLLQEVASNPGTASQILEKLAIDNDGKIRLKVAGNPNAPAKVLEQLAQDNNVEFRTKVAQNPKTPARILKQLAWDDELWVRLEVAWNLNFCVTLLEEWRNEAQTLVSPMEQIGSNPQIPVKLLEEWMKNYHSSSVTQKVTKHSKTSIDEEARIRAVAAWYLAQNPEELPVVLEHYAKKTTSSFSHLCLLLHPQMPGKVLVDDCRSSVWLERYAIAQHPNTPLDTLHTLAVDGNRIVRAAAQANLQNRYQQP